MKKTKNLCSPAHALYLKRRRRENIAVQAARAGLLLLLLGVWELVARLELADPFIISSPSRIAKVIGSLAADGSLFYHIGTTLWETLAGFTVAVIAGTTIALLLWWSERARRILEPYIVVLNALPKIALGPVIIVWFGAGAPSIVFMTVLVSIIVATMHMLEGFLSTDKNKMLLLASMGAGRRQMLTKLVLPSAAARVYRHAEDQRGHGVDRLHHGGIHRLQGGTGLLDRIRRAGVPLRPGDGGDGHPLPAGRGHVRPGGAGGKAAAAQAMKAAAKRADGVPPGV